MAALGAAPFGLGCTRSFDCLISPDTRSVNCADAPQPSVDAGASNDMTGLDAGQRDANEPDDAQVDIETLSVGAPCDVESTTQICAAGSSCLVAGGSPIGSSPPRTPTCVADGSSGGRCQAEAPACEIGLLCNRIESRAPDARCVPPLPIASPCDSNAEVDACAPHGQCLANAGAALCMPLRHYAVSVLATPSFVDACAEGERISRFAIPGWPASLGLRDDGHAPEAFAIPFDFRFFGALETKVWPAINGYVTIGDAPPNDTSFSSTHPRVRERGGAFAFGADFLLRDSPSSDVCVKLEGVEPNRRLVVMWLDMYLYQFDWNAHITFELVLHEQTSEIDFIYGAMNTVAFSPGSGFRPWFGLQTAFSQDEASYTGTPRAGLGLRFTPIP